MIDLPFQLNRFENLKFEIFHSPFSKIVQLVLRRRRTSSPLEKKSEDSDLIEVGSTEQNFDFWFILLQRLQTGGDPNCFTRCLRIGPPLRGCTGLRCRNERRLLLESTDAPFAIAPCHLSLAGEEKEARGYGLLLSFVVRIGLQNPKSLQKLGPLQNRGFQDFLALTEEDPQLHRLTVVVEEGACRCPAQKFLSHSQIRKATGCYLHPLLDDNTIAAKVGLDSIAKTRRLLLESIAVPLAIAPHHLVLAGEEEEAQGSGFLRSVVVI